MSIASLPRSLGNEELEEGYPPSATIRPFRDEEDFFIVERKGGPTSLIRQGLARTGSAAVKYTFEKPIDVRDPIPFVLVPGYGGIKPAYKELRQALVAQGKAAATFRPPRNQKRFAGFHPNHFTHPERLLAQAVLAVSEDILITDGKQDNYDQVDAAGHSMGGPAITAAALVKPNRFRSVTLMASSGLDGHTIWDMAERTPGVLAHEILPALKNIRVQKNTRSLRHFIEYVAFNPWRTIAEGLAVSSSNIRDEISQVGALGVWTAAQQFAQDRFFPLEGVQELSEHRFDEFHVFPDLGAGHLAPQMQPEAVGEDLINIIAILKKRHA